jgi:hypothetical protein
MGDKLANVTQETNKNLQTNDGAMEDIFELVKGEGNIL